MGSQFEGKEVITQEHEMTGHGASQAGGRERGGAQCSASFSIVFSLELCPGNSATHS